MKVGFNRKVCYRHKKKKEKKQTNKEQKHSQFSGSMRMALIQRKKSIF